MDDHEAYGPVFHELKFDDAVHKYHALSDYRVRIAFIDPSSWIQNYNLVWQMKKDCYHFLHKQDGCLVACLTAS